MKIQTKEINVLPNFNKYFISFESKEVIGNFISEKIQNSINAVEAALLEETDDSKKEAFSENFNFLNKLVDDCCDTSENEILFITNDTKSKIEAIENISNNLNNIKNMNSELISDNISKSIFGENVENLTEDEKKIVENINDLFGLEKEKNKNNPFANPTAVLMGLSVSIPSCKGLRRNFLEAIRKSKEGPEDKYSERYAENITQVAEDYLRDGVKGISTHVGGYYSCSGSGTAIQLDCSSGHKDCVDKIVSYYKKKDTEQLSDGGESDNIATAISEMYDDTNAISFISGIYIEPGSPPIVMPLSENSLKASLDCSSNKKIMKTTIDAAYKVLDELKKSGKFVEAGLGEQFEDTDDILAAAFAAGLKAMIAMSSISANSPHAAEGSGLLIPYKT